MIAREVMMQCPVTLEPEWSVGQAAAHASTADLDILPVVDRQGRYHGAVSKAALLDAAPTNRPVRELCCGDALVLQPDSAIENLSHDSASTIPHRTLMVVDGQGRFHGVIPQVHWAVDEARVQSGHPRSPLEVRSYAMHLTYRCLACGGVTQRNDGPPGTCPHCGAGSEDFALYTED